MGGQQLLGTLHGHAQFVGKSVGGLSVDDAKIQCLAQRPLLVGHVGFGDVQHAGGSAGVEVDIVLEGMQQGGVLGEAGEDAQFHLRVVGLKQDMAWRSFDGRKHSGGEAPASLGRCN